MKLRLVLLMLTAIVTAASFIAAPYPVELVLQHVPTVIGLLLLLTATVFFNASSLSFICSVLFLWLHIIGARWIYSFVPYDDWAVVLTGQTLSDRFGWERNHYDRLVHLASGILGMPIFAEALQVFCRLRPFAAAGLAMTCVLALGALYEILEWQIAMVFSPEMAEAYNGQQGDVWDAQKDLALAGCGALFSAPLLAYWEARTRAAAESLP